MSYKVKLQTFEGPFDLLVYLIENAQMSIYDIEIKSITGQYLEYIKSHAGNGYRCGYRIYGAGLFSHRDQIQDDPASHQRIGRKHDRRRSKTRISGKARRI